MKTEKFRRKPVDTLKCKCGKQAALKPSSPTSSWNVRTRTSIVGTPENTGVSSVDHNADRILGAESKRAWVGIQSRHELKRKIVNDNPGSYNRDVALSSDGGYRVMSSEESDSKHSLREETHSQLRESEK